MGERINSVAAASEISRAIKASGAIIQVEAEVFEALLKKTENPLVIYAKTRFLSVSYKYLTSYKGLIFFAQTSSQLSLPNDTEIIQAKDLWIPG